jgi:glycine dehydrogenase subunit 2
MAGMMMIKAYHQAQGRRKTKIIVPDSAHGTNPASASLCGFKAVEVRSDARGGIDLESLKAVLDEDVAGLMLTNPNTLGVFDENILEIADRVHQVGGLLYYDGANLNAILGRARPGDMGFDVVHLNLHKTFSTPHGGGGPGAGPVGVREHLLPFLPQPVVIQDGDTYRFDAGSWLTLQRATTQGCPYDLDRPQSIGKLLAFHGNVGILLRAYAYLRTHGAEGLRQVSNDAVLNANYLLARLRDHFDVPFDRLCKHEFVLSGSRQKARGVSVLNLAKRLIDYGFHPPTIYFPLPAVVEEAMMIEPVETESKETLDAFYEALVQIDREIDTDPDLVNRAPHTAPVARLDEVKAARELDVRWPGKGREGDEGEAPGRQQQVPINTGSHSGAAGVPPPARDR